MRFPRRHQLARLADAGWAAVLQRAWDAQAAACLAHWSTHRLPLVVTAQPADAVAEGLLALGLPAPQRWDRRRLALRVPARDIDDLEEFPRLADLAPGLPTAVRELADALGARRATARVFGSHGWQAITGLDHVRPSSDLDLWIAVDGVEHADAVARELRSFDGSAPRLDGELVFDDGAAVAWREWADWRAGRARAVLVRQGGGVALRHDTAWCMSGASMAPRP